jgi:hypothetical protein
MDKFINLIEEASDKKMLETILGCLGLTFLAGF